MKDNKISLTEKQVRRLADDEASYQRGVAYYESGAVCNPVRQGKELRGECYGSRDNPYRVQVVFNDRGVESAACSCPRGGFCKHIVALLLKYVHEPDVFEVASSLNAVLSRLSKEDLIALISDLVLREPALASVVELAAGTVRGQSLDVAALNREVFRTLGLHDPDDIEADLRHILHTAEHLARQGDWVGAGTVYEAVLDALTDSYEDKLQGMDEDGEIACITRDCVGGLTQCLASGTIDRHRRQDWLVTMMEAELADIEMGGIDYGGNIMEAILKYADEQDWELLRTSVHERMPDKEDWQRERLVEILVAWEERHNRQEQARQLIRELGTFEQQMFLKIEEGQPEEAMNLAKRHFKNEPGLIEKLAKTLDKAGAGEHAAALLTELAGSKETYDCYLEWLADYHLRHDQPEMALTWQRRLFQQCATLASFKTLRRIAQQLGVWPQTRDEVLKVAEHKKEIGVLIEIALDEKDVARALELLPKLPRWGWHDYRGEVAKAAEAKYPAEATRIYRETVESVIEQRQRGQYGYAVSLLCRMRDLYQCMDDIAGWASYLASLKNRCTRFTALKEELRKAGL
jgi:uncharacterized Zn finger protein